jgi:predicted nicotinamide N-methyase
MGNQNASENEVQAKPYEQSHKIVLRLRYRDIILHYAFKMKVSIADIDVFPSNYEGLRLWDTDVVLSRFIILENERFKDKDVFVFKAGVGLSGISLSKWGGCKSITMCDMNEEVVRNMSRNCQINNVKDVNSEYLKLHELDHYESKYDIVLSSDLFAEGFTPSNILNIWRKLLKAGG